MKRFIIAFVSLIFVCLTLISGFGTSACAAPSSFGGVVGEWVGGYKFRGSYTPIYVRFKSEGKEIRATLDLPMRRTTGIALSEVKFQSPNLHFEWPSTAPIIFEGQISADFITGNIQSGSERGTFHLVRTVTLDAKVFDQYVGDYQIGRDRYITVARTEFPTPGITFKEHDSSNPERRRGQLFPSSETTFFVGAGRRVPYPVEINATFVKNDQGQVTALKWKPTGSPEIVGKKVKLHLYDEEQVKFSNGNVTLAGTLYLPLRKGPHPAVVLLPGSDPSPRGRGYESPQFFAQHGMVALVYDRRGSFESTGDLNASVSGLEDLASDAAAGIRLLQSRPDVSPSQVGVWGISQGGWVAEIVAATMPNIAFLILHAGPAVSPREQGHMELASTLPSRYGLQQDELKEAIEYQNLYNDAMRSDSAYEKLQATYEQLQARGVRWIWAPGTREQLRQIGNRLSIDLDPVPFLEKIKCPVLAFFGGKDPLVPPEGNVEIMRAALKRGGNKDVTIKVLPEGDHLLWLPGIDFYGTGSSGKSLPSGYYDVMIEWIKKRVKAR